MPAASPLATISRELSAALSGLRFRAPVAYVYDPLDYARAPHEAYLARYGRGPVACLWLGMNPGPFGMAQTGVPFGDVTLVRDWLGVSGEVRRPEREHPKRPVLGFACPRREVSGSRLWGFARARFRTPAAFFARFFVANWCPLAFVEASGANRTPDKLPEEERAPLVAACDLALARTVEALRVRQVVGVGAFAAARARVALRGTDVRIDAMPHPSPASPAANRGWDALAAKALRDAGIEVPGA